MENISDDDLMLKVKAGDLDKAGLLFERHKKLLYGYFVKMTGDKSVSEDLVQNVFYKIIKYRTRFRGDGKFKSWMIAIARNVSFDYFKKNERYSSDNSPYDWKIIDGLSVDEQIIKEEQIRQLNTALKKLDYKKREIIILSRLKGLRYKEIGELLNCTENYVKTKVYRALNELRMIYAEIENEKS